MPRVLLASMPYGSLERPSMGLGLLQAQLHRRGIPCDTRYLAFAFAELVGVEDYQWLSSELPYTAFAGDWLFTQALYGPRPAGDAAYVEEILRGQWRLPDAAIARLSRLRASCEPFLEHCLESVAWERYDVVGFTSTFEQNLASLALARRVKERHPGAFVVFGGANWEGEMGQELHRQFEFVDAVCSGEADETFPALLAAIDAGASPASVRGIVYRENGRTIATKPAPIVRDLDALPLPDFDPWVADRERIAPQVAPLMLVETGRGCWWGAKSHCTFCGLNGGSLAFRSKSPKRALSEIRHLQERYGIAFFAAVDNILDMGYFRTLLPRLAAEPQGTTFFYEVKANLSGDQVALLAAAGVTIVQPGVESLSDRVLKLMGKGTSALQNVALLKWCREHGVRAEWNVLYGFPGETAQDYVDMAALIDDIWFLDPPSGCGPVRMDRFSPYHEDPASFGMVNVRPLAPYRHLYPFDRDALMRTAYYFEYDHADGRQPISYAAPVVERVQRWSSDDSRGGLWVMHEGDDRLVVDERPAVGPRGMRLYGWQSIAYDACDRVRTLQGLTRMPELSGVGGDLLGGFLDACVANRIMVRRGDRYLALAVTRPARAWRPVQDPAAVQATA
jgi:ribosomal peptide maturation radical SAM protein 1